MNEYAIDIYDYDGTLCDNQDYLNRLSIVALEEIIENTHSSIISDDERKLLEHAIYVDYAGDFWEVKAPAILKEFGIEYDHLDDHYTGAIDTARKQIRDEFYGKEPSGTQPDNDQTSVTEKLKQKVTNFFIKSNGYIPKCAPFDDVEVALNNPMTIKAIATQQEHDTIETELSHFPEIGDHIGNNFTGTGKDYNINNDTIRPAHKPEPDLILTQYQRLVQKYDDVGVDIRDMPVRMTGDSVLDVISMRKAQEIINANRAEDQKIDCSVIGVVRKGTYAKEISNALINASKDPEDTSGNKDIKIHIVENFQQHRELTDRLDGKIISVNPNINFDL